MEIKMNQLTEELKEQAQHLVIRLKGDFITVVLYAHLGLYLFRMTMTILRHFNII